MSAYLYITELDKELTELEDEVAALIDEGKPAEDERTEHEWISDEVDTERLKALRALRDDMDGTWQDILRHGGDGLIPEDEFTDYAKQLADDIGAIRGEQDWPLRHIDWDAAADELKADYYTVTFEGTDYYYREP